MLVGGVVAKMPWSASGGIGVAEDVAYMVDHVTLINYQA
jgi:hypothetical protein